MMNGFIPDKKELLKFKDAQEEYSEDSDAEFLVFILAIFFRKATPTLYELSKKSNEESKSSVEKTEGKKIMKVCVVSQISNQKHSR